MVEQLFLSPTFTSLRNPRGWDFE